MHTRPPGWHVAAIPVAVAVDKFGHNLDYTGVVGLRDAFLSRVGNSEGEDLNRAIAHLLKLDATTLSFAPYLLGADDKGVLDFVRMSFWIFGYNVEGFLYTYFLMLGLSAVCFLVAFCRRTDALFLLTAFLCAHLAYLPTVVINPELKSVIAMRFMPVVSMIAVLHILLYVFRPRTNLGHIVGVIAQIGIIVFTIHVRQSALWQLVAIAAGTGVALIWTGNGFRTRSQRRFSIGHAAKIVWPSALLFAAFVALLTYQHAAYAEPYRRGDQIAGHVFWHSLFTGFAFHPRLGKELDVRVDDVSVIRAAGRFLTSRGRHSEWDRIGGTSPGFRDIKWAPYDQVVREMYFDVWRHRPIESIVTALVHRPLAFFSMLAWLAGLTAAPPYLELLNPDGQRALLDMHNAVMTGGFAYNPASPWILLILTPYLVALLPAGAGAFNGAIGPFAVFVVGAWMPTFFVYPHAHTIGEPAMATTTLLYVLVTSIVAVATKSRTKRDGRDVPSALPPRA